MKIATTILFFCFFCSQLNAAEKTIKTIDLKRVSNLITLFDHIQNDKSVIKESIAIHTGSYVFRGKIIAKSNHFVTTASDTRKKSLKTGKKRYMIHQIPMSSILYVSYDIYD